MKAVAPETNKRNFTWGSSHSGSLSEGNQIVVTGNACQEKGSLSLNLLKPTGHVMHHQFNIQQLYALPTLYLCVLYLSQNKQRLVPLAA